MLIFYKEFFFIYHLRGKKRGNFWGGGGAHGFRGNEEGAKEKFNSRMPYLYLGAEQVCLREGENFLLVNV